MISDLSIHDANSVSIESDKSEKDPSIQWIKIVIKTEQGDIEIGLHPSSGSVPNIHKREWELV